MTLIILHVIVFLFIKFSTSCHENVKYLLKKQTRIVVFNVLSLAARISRDMRNSFHANP
jgi:hypothetical protein